MATTSPDGLLPFSGSSRAFLQPAASMPQAFVFSRTLPGDLVRDAAPPHRRDSPPHVYLSSSVVYPSTAQSFGFRARLRFAGRRRPASSTDVAPSSKRGAASEAAGQQEKKPVTFGRLFQLLKPDLHLLGLAAVFLVSAAVAQALIPHFISQTLQNIIDAQNNGTLAYRSFLSPLRYLLAAGTVAAICASLRGALFILIGARSSRRLRQQLFRSLVVQDVGFFDTTKTGVITSRLTQDCSKASDTLTFNVNIFSRTIVQLLVTLCFMLYHSPTLTAYSFATVPIAVVISKVYGNFMQRLSRKTQEKLAEANAVAEEVFSSIPTVRSFAGEKYETECFADKLEDYMTLEKRRAKYYITWLTSNLLLPQLCNCLVFFQIGNLCMKGFHAPKLLVFAFYLQTLQDCFGTIADFYTSISQALGSASDVFELIDRKPADGDSSRVQTVESEAPSLHQSPAAESQPATSTLKGHIKLKGISFTYPARPSARVLQDLTLDCPPGSVVALVGPSGGGKSTCMSLMQRLYKPASGAVTLDDVDVWDYDHTDFHQIVSVVGQEPQLFGRTIRENILFGLPDDHPARKVAAGEGEKEEDSEVVRASRLANAHDFISALPDGYETDVGERGVQMSGGQKQRIAIARALVRRPKVLLMDEATSALDVQSEMLVQHAINNLIDKHDTTVVVIAHRLSTVRQADKICVIKGGALVEQGSHAELLQKDGAYAQLIKDQMYGFEADGIATSRAAAATVKEETEAASVKDLLLGTGSPA
eukprot:TRINITY_DN111379_c0_g1_i1.p1 TRINITY_DN111379_c0_g1~~TRINITY_DN111379_c0_g1_i1.p1  ORF type:complete len:761 (+),score=150.54 TRINITY_DN111379_c0_g1_i1:97-2379(+)